MTFTLANGSFFFQGVGKEAQQRRVLVDSGDHAAVDLVCADGVVGGFKLAHCRVVGRKAGDLVLEKDVMAAMVSEGVGRQYRSNFRHGLLYCLGFQKARQVKHPTVGQVDATAFDQCGIGLAFRPVYRVGFEIDKVAHNKFRVYMDCGVFEEKAGFSSTEIFLHCKRYSYAEQSPDEVTAAKFDQGF